MVAGRLSIGDYKRPATIGSGSRDYHAYYKKCLAKIKRCALWDLNHGRFAIMAVFSLYCTPVKEPLLLSTFKNKLCLSQRHSFHFEQVLSRSMLTWLSYQHDADRQMDRQLFSFII